VYASVKEMKNEFQKELAFAQGVYIGITPTPLRGENIS
jgi:hypothetical protein